MNSEFIPYEHALALKELGFDEPCFAKYTVILEDDINWFTIPEQGITDKTSFGSSKNYNSKSFKEEGTISAPTFSQAFRWFREKDYYSEIRVGCTQIDGGIGYEWWVWKPNGIEEWSPEVPGEEWSYETYEEAEQACLDKLIEIVKNGRNNNI